jgi:hypothetical protein
MAADLKYLAYTAVLTATLWTPYIVSQVQARMRPYFWSSSMLRSEVR